ASESLVEASPGTVTASAGSSARTITVTVKDANGNPVSGATVTLAASPVTGITLTQPAGTTNTSGQITGALSSTAAGTKTVTAIVNGSVPITESAAVSVNPAAAATIGPNGGSGQQAPAGSTLPVPPSVIVTDAFGNPVSGVSVTFAPGPGSGSVTGATQMSDASGIATVGSWTLGPTAGQNTLMATAGSLSGSPVTFTAVGTAGAATQLTISTPPPATAQSGVAFTPQPVLQLRDANGNAVSQAGTRVTAVIATGPTGATLTNATATTTGSGAATFNGLAISGSVGGYTLRFESGTLSAPTSGTITLSAGTAATIAANSPTSQPGTAGAAVSSPPSVIVKDANGNPVSGVAVTFSEEGATGSEAPTTPVSRLGSGGAKATSWTRGTAVRTDTARAPTRGPSERPATWTVTLRAGTAATIAANSPTSQPGTAGAAVSSPPSVIVKDANGN